MIRLIRHRAARLAIGAVLLAFLTPALADTWRPLRWAFSMPSVAGPGGKENGFASCVDAGRAGYAFARRVHPQGIDTLGNTEDSCSFANPILWSYRIIGDFPTSPSRDITLDFYCETGAGPVNVPGLGLSCQADGENAENPSKSIGYCPECSLAVGNPIFPGNGNKLLREVDYVGAGPFPLRFERVYNSGSFFFVKTTPLGHNVWHPYFRKLLLAGLVSGNYVIVDIERPDGRTANFNLVGSDYVSDPDESGRLEKISGGYRYTNTEDEAELYNETGVLQSISNRAGLTQTLTYFTSGANAGLLEKVTDAFGRTLTFEYDNRARISAVVNPEGGRYTYAYTLNEQRFNLTSVTYPDTRTRFYHYENPFQQQIMHGITDELGVRYATYAYDGAFRGTLSEHAGGAGKVTVFHDDSIGKTSVTTHVSATSSSTRVYSFILRNGIRRTTGITGPACPQCGPATMSYDANGNPSSRMDWNGNRTNYSFDTLGRNLEFRRTEGLTAANGIVAETRFFEHAWHPTFRLMTGKAEALRLTTWSYDASGNMLTKSIQATTDASGGQRFAAIPTGAPRTWTYTYNANGQVLTMDGPRTDVADTTTYTYYANNDADVNKRGNVASITNAMGQATQITAYNAHGQPLTIVDPNGLTTTLTYDPRQRLTSRSVGGETTTYTYDFAGQLTKVTLPDGSFLSYTYDPAHRLTGIQDNLGNRIVYTLDRAGNRTLEQVFDPSNALAQTRSRVISNINRLFRELGATGQTTEYAYDNQGNVTSVKDPLNRTTTNQYDRLNRLKQVTDANTVPGVTLYGYNGLDALTQVTDPRNLVTGYTVDGLGNLTQQSSPDTGNTVNTYDLAGNLATQTDAKGQATSYAYDALNRVTLITFHDGSKQAYAYDLGTNAVGRLSSITETDPANAVTSLIAYGYDQKGRVTSETRTVGGVASTLSYSYDSFGRLVGMTYPSGRTLTYTLDALGRISQVTTTKDAQSQIVVQNVQYHPFGGAKSWTLGNGQIYSRTVDQDGRIASYTLGSANYSIAFDDASRITGIAQAGVPANTNTYGYDNLDRLISAVLPSSNFGYSYDAVGNRLTKTVAANTDTYTYGATSNRIATLTPAAGSPRSFLLDANGSTTDDALNQYSYDTRGRMVQAISTAGTTSYQANALGQRIRKTGAANDTVFHYDTWGKLIAETDPGGTPKREYLYLGDIPVGVIQ